MIVLDLRSPAHRDVVSWKRSRPTVLGDARIP